MGCDCQTVAFKAEQIINLMVAKMNVPFIIIRFNNDNLNLFIKFH